MEKKRPDRFKRWMIASFFLISLVLFGSVAGYYYLHTPAKIWVAVRLLGYNRTRTWAAIEIHQAGDGAIPYLVGGFGSRNPRVRSEALYRVDLIWSSGAGFNLDESVRHLVKGLRSRNANVRCSSAKALSRLPTWESPNRDPRQPHFLQVIRDNSVVLELTKCLSDPEAKVRAMAARALGRLEQLSKKP